MLFMYICIVGTSLSKLKAYIDVCGYVQLLVAGHGVTHVLCK